MRALNLAHAAAVTAGALMCGLDVVSTMFRNSSWVLSWRPTQMMRAFSGRSLATSRAYIAGSSLRIARSPLPPNRTRSKSVSAIVYVFAVRLRARGAPDYICKFTTRISQAQENLLHNGACQRVRGVFRLFLIRGLGLAGDGYPQLEHLAIMRVLRQFCRRAVVAGAGDVQRAQICAAEGQHGWTAHRQLHFLQHHALRRNAQHARALEQRAPVVAGAVDGGAIGTAAVIGRRFVGRELLEQLLVRHRAGGHIVGVVRDAVGRRVRVVHGAPVGTEAEAVGIGHAAGPRQAQLALFQHVHFGGLLVARLVDGADPEAAGRIGAAVVEAHLARVVGRGDDVGDGAAARVQMDDGAPQRHHQSAAGAVRQCRRFAVHLPVHVGAGLRMQAVHGAAVDVDPVQRLFQRMPQRAFADLHDAVVGDFDSVFGHRMLPQMWRAALAITIRPLVELSCWAGAGSPVSSFWICLASTLPSSTPHWSKLLTSHSTPCTNTLCSYSAIKAPSEIGVSWSIKMVLLGRLPGKVLCGTSASISVALSLESFKSARTSSPVLPFMKASDWAKQLASSASWWPGRSWVARSATMKSMGVTSVPWWSSWK